VRQRCVTLTRSSQRPPLINGLSIIGITAFGIWTLSTPRPLHADSRSSAFAPLSQAPDVIQEARRLAHNKANSGSTYNTNELDPKKSGEQSPPPQTKVEDQKDDKSTGVPWSWFTTKMGSIKWSSIPDQISEFVMPEWLRLFPQFMSKLQNELSMAPGTLAEEIWSEANDPEHNPEIIWDANVRVSDNLSKEETEFLEKRRIKLQSALAKYLDIPESEINPDDIPTIAMCGSGGGLRALVAGSGSYISAREAGLFDCATYTAGVSGSCWLQTLFFTTMGKQSHEQVIQHLKNRLGVHLAYPPAVFNLINSAPTNKYLLTGLVEKLKGTPDADFGIVDVYGMLLAGRLLVPKAELGVDYEDLKLTTQQQFLDQGQNPLPIYAAVRHELPVAERKTLTADEVKEKAKQEQWFQWFEFTPYEFWCEEMGAGIPAWAVGRQFENGKTVWRQNGMSLPEVRVPMLMGIWGSAFCATLSHYYKEIRPVMKSLAGFGGIDQIIAERDEDLIKVHPIDPAALPNFAYGMQGQLPQSCPQSIYEAKYLQLMDAGMSNNLPIYPLLRPGRNVDVIIAFDASADVKTDNWLKVVDGYARQRNIIGWPIGAGWPPASETAQEVTDDLEKAQAKSQDDALEHLKEAQKDNAATQSNQSSSPQVNDLGYCNVWVGSTAERTTSGDQPSAKLLDDGTWDETVGGDDAGITVVYFPLLKNEKMPGVDPKTSDYLSTWNFVYSPDQIDDVVGLARANFAEGADQTKRTIRAIYERKKRKRLEREKEEKEWRRRRKLQGGLIRGKKGEGDHFS
jgi:phospholipase A2